MRATRALLALLVIAAAGCSRDADPLAPESRPGFDSGVTIGSGGRSGSGSGDGQTTSVPMDSTTLRSGVFIGSGG